MIGGTIMEIKELVNRQRTYFQSHITIDINYRLTMLKKLRETIQAKEPQILSALKEDLGKSETEGYMCEVGLTLSELSYQISHLKRWARPKTHHTGLVNFHAHSFTVQEPYGCVLIMSPWNYPFMLCMEPLIGALAAGNCCIVKPSAYSPATSAIIAEIIREVFPQEYVAAVEGGRAENTELLNQRFDYIFFTGGVTVGKLVMEKASAHLTPVTLELGGKSPCIIDRTANLQIAATRLAFGKFLNCGQTCVAPDYVLIDRSVKDAFLPLLKEQIIKMYGAHPLDNPNYGKIVNRKHFDRLLGLITPDKTILGGESDSDALRIAPTVLDHVTSEDPVMQEEIFGPILPILTYDTLDEAEDFITSREKPLALYLFTGDKSTEERFLKHVSFGGGCINDTVIHLATSEMGFGGVGNSGMGSYHGKKSFDTFSHAKSIVKKYCWLDMPMRYQPYRKAYLKLIRLFLH